MSRWPTVESARGINTKANDLVAVDAALSVVAVDSVGRNSILVSIPNNQCGVSTLHDSLLLLND